MYWIGNFDGKHFVPDDIKARFVDFGYDFQAFQTWNNYVDDRVLMIGWMCVWDYCGLVPTRPWKGAQSLVRELSLEREASAIILVQKPVKQMEKLRSALKLELDKTDTLTARKMFRTNKVRGRSLEIKVEFKPHAKTKKVGFQIRSGEKEETIVCYDHFKEAVYIDRAKSGIIHKKMSLVDSANVVLQNGTLKLWIFLDWSSVEVFVNDGRQVITNLIFPQNDSSDEVDIFCLGHEAEVVSLKIYELNTTWEKYWNNNTWGGLTDNLKKVHIFKMNSIKAHSNLTEVSDSNYLWIFISVLIVCYGLLLNLLCRSFSRYF
ncbi:uncharacterized protein LOC106170449 isoform X1 [Lingula anatina]|uniref:Uncharacterized protein LOC106170449 isoform X1 n=1 Tax=Lingula anatina TaxID=7574 RepID=A0A1S3J5U3_LINAN|nr:uncharacterized protein LOC106170449 isoform X1 [Lingula anatina]|eukprot:XP_013405765.1 uncharacterized protein LOC106170449 isoform X1 [Lingula anatina]